MVTIEELLAENKKLKEENNRLKELLRKNNIDYTNENEKILTTDDKIKIYLSYFKGRNDVYAEKYIKDGKKAYTKVCDNRFNRNLCDIPAELVPEYKRLIIMKGKMKILKSFYIISF